VILLAAGAQWNGQHLALIRQPLTREYMSGQHQPPWALCWHADGVYLSAFLEIARQRQAEGACVAVCRCWKFPDGYGTPRRRLPHFHRAFSLDKKEPPIRGDIQLQWVAAARHQNFLFKAGGILSEANR
jgi:hypothetical protein